MIQTLLDPQAWLGGLGIFCLRVCDMSMDTMRVRFVVRGSRGLAWILGFFQSVIFIVAVASVLTNVSDIPRVIGYAAGFATGTVVGMTIEEHLALGHVHMTIMSSSLGAAIAESLREQGFAVTEIPARGKNGAVLVLHVDVRRKDVNTVETAVLETDSSAFVTSDEVHPVWRGYWRA